MTELNQTDTALTHTFWSEHSQEHGLSVDKLARLDPTQAEVYPSVLPTLDLYGLSSVWIKSKRAEESHPALTADVLELAKAWGNVSGALMGVHVSGPGRELEWREALPTDIEAAVGQLYLTVHKRIHGVDPSEADRSAYTEKSKGFTAYAIKTISQQPEPGTFWERLDRAGGKWMDNFANNVRTLLGE